MSKFKSGKKILSVFLALLMVFSMWGGFTPFSLEAKAANGSYTVDIYYTITDNTWNSSNNYTGKDAYKSGSYTSVNGFSIIYANENGRSTTGGEVYFDIGKATVSSGQIGTGATITRTPTAHVHSSSKTSDHATVVLPGFPTEIFIGSENNTVGGGKFTIDKIVINNKTAWSGSFFIGSSNRKYWGSLKNDGTLERSSNASEKNVNVETTSSNWEYPYVATSTSQSATTAPKDIGIPPLGDKKDVSISSTTAQYYMTDQYGVRYEPTSYSVSGVSNLTTSGGTSGSAYKVTATTSTTPSTTAISQTATITMNWKNPNYTGSATQHADTTATLKVYNPRYKVTYNGNGGTLGTGYTYAYKNQAVNASTSTATSNNVAGLDAEKFPTAGNREGYTFNGIWSSASGGTQKNATDKVTANATWYAQWTVNQYNAVFKGNKGTYPDTPYEYDITTVPTDFGTMPIAPTTVEDYDNGDYHYTYNGNWKNAEGTSYSASSLPNMTVTGAIYTAQYDSEFIKADYSKVEEYRNSAASVIATPNYEGIYTEASRNALSTALNSVVDNLGRTQQEVVDGYATAIKNAIDGLEGEKYSVVFVDSRTNSIIKFDYPTFFGATIVYPEEPEMSYDSTYHYTFKEWVGSANESAEQLKTVSKNTTILAKFTATKHDYETETIESTCVKEGGTKYTCKDCGYTYTEYSGTTGDHKYSTEWTTDVEPTCTTPGSKSHHCLVCDAKSDVTEIEALGHDYTGVEESTIVPVSCENDGVSIKECTRCGYNHYITYPKTEHDMEDVVTPATCTSKGYTTSTCSKCEKMLIGSFTDPTDHNYIIKNDECVAPSCESVGYNVYYCKDCNLKKYEIVNATGHDFDGEPTVDIEPTCTTKGQQSVHCSKCGKINESTITEIGANGHTYDDTKSEMLAPDTCTTAGIKMTPCSVEGCGYFKTEEVDEIKGHDLKETENTTATCTDAGVLKKECQRVGCDYSTVEVTPAKGHNFVLKETHNATCSSSAYEHYECDCGEKYDKITAGAIDHDFTITTEKTSTTKLKITAKCKNCTYSKETTVDVAEGHSYDKVTVSSYPTCSQQGEIVVSCSAKHNGADCADKITVSIPKDETAHKNIETYVKDATCTQNGSITVMCKDCQTQIGEAVAITATGHTFDIDNADYTTYTTGDCKNPATVTFKCTTAGCEHTETYTLSVDPDAHKYGEPEKVAATCTTPAYDKYTCTVDGCSHSYNKYDGTSKALGHDWEATIEKNGTLVQVVLSCQRDGCTESNTTLIVNDFNSHNFNKVDVVQATCNSSGKVTVTCGDEGCSEKLEFDLDTDESVHMNLETKVTPATCTKDGEAYTWCNDCNEKVGTSVILTKLGHNFSGTETNVVNPTCDTAGTKTVQCTNCTETTEVTIAKLGHTYKKVEGQGKDATCTEYGWDLYECENDKNHTYKALVEATGHTIEGDVTTVQPTCTEQGYDLGYCTACKENVKSNFTDALGHSYTHVTTDPTCTDKGYTTHTCQRKNCGYSYTDTYTDKLGHDFENEGEVIQEGSCTTQKIVKHKCNHVGCEEYRMDYVAGTGSHDEYFVETVAPTCTTPGYDLYKCNSCPDDIKKNYKSELGHDWDYWEIKTYPTETENGLQERKCLRCGETETEEIIYGKYYLVTFYNFDGIRLIRPAYYAYGKKARMPQTDPIRVADAAYTYTFKGYSYTQAEIDCVTKTMAVIAEYDAHERSYAVTYLNGDGSVLQTISSVLYTQIGTSYTGATPTKASDGKYTYTFESWSVSCDTETMTATVIPVFSSKLIDPDADKQEGILTRFIEWLKNFFKKIFGNLF